MAAQLEPIEVCRDDKNKAVVNLHGKHQHIHGTETPLSEELTQTTKLGSIESTVNPGLSSFVSLYKKRGKSGDLSIQDFSCCII